MSEDLDSEEKGEGYLKEIEEGRVIDNLHLLELAFVDQEAKVEVGTPTRHKLGAIKNKGSWATPLGSDNSITIEYDTRTGEIGFGRGDEFGDSSLIRTTLVETGDTSPKLEDGRWVRSPKIKRMILLHRPGDMPSVSQYSTSLMGKPIGPNTGNRRILPERIDPDHRDLMGIEEIWGKSEFVESANGDLVMLRTIRKFNEIYGPEH